MFVEAEVETEDVLRQLDTDDLIDELERRGDCPGAGALTPNQDIRLALGTLKQARVPDDIAQRIEEWMREPVASREALLAWTGSQGVH